MKKRLEKTSNKNKKINKWIYWTPRILSILFILFLAMFSLDVFDGCNGFFDCSLGLFMHNIPSLVMLVFLIFAWKRELVGTVIFAFGGLLYLGLMIRNALSNPVEFYMLSYSFIITGPAFLIAYLWYLNWKKKK